MRGTELLDKMELVNAAFVQAADQPPAGKRRGRIRWLAVAACFCFVAVAALALWRGSTPAQPTPALEKLRIPDLVPGGMGFEGYLYYRAAELENGNPWHEGMALSSLPVYRNAAYDASGLGIAKGLDEAQMRALLDSAVSALGAAVRSVETVTAEGADTVTELRAATDRGELRAGRRDARLPPARRRARAPGGVQLYRQRHDRRCGAGDHRLPRRALQRPPAHDRPRAGDRRRLQHLRRIPPHLRRL